MMMVFLNNGWNRKVYLLAISKINSENP